jgi:hypothetical protein
MFGVAAIACSTYVVAWYGSILSESLSISLLALLFASLARWQRTGGGLWAVVLITGLWALTRSTNGYLVLLVGLIILPYALMRHRRRVAQAGWVLAAGLLATILSAQGQLWQQPFSHSLTQRILPNAGFTAWFAAHGMPDDDVLRQFAGPYSFSTDTALQQSPALASFRHWMDRSGKFTYMEFLFTHPVWILQGTFGRHEELPPQTIAYYGRTRPWLAAPFRDLFLSHRQATLLLLGTVDAAALVVVVRRRIWGPRAGLWLGVIGLGLVTLAVDWAGDAWEIGRHSIQGTIGVALAGLMLITCLGTDSTLGPEPAPELSVRRRGAPRR